MVPNSVPAVTAPIVARITGATDRFDIAAAAAQTVVESPSSGPMASLTAGIGLALMAVHSNALVTVKKQYGNLESIRGTLAPRGPGLAIDRILGLTVNGESRAYPIRMMTYHHIANDQLGGVPVLVTF